MPTVNITYNNARDCNDANPGHVNVSKSGTVTFRNQTGYQVDLDLSSCPVSPSTLQLAAGPNSTGDVTVNANAASGEYDYSISGNGKPECEPPGNKPSMIVD